ncbi:MAG: acyltransferase [Ruminococcus sp.]|nr:acyltransferase [Ruminococcus sp.]
MKSKKYYYYISDMKIVCLMFVIIGHCALFFISKSPYITHQGVSSQAVDKMFDILDMLLMPAFIIGSGFLYANSITNNKNATMISEIVRRSKSILVPFLLWGVFWTVPMYTIFNIVGYGRPENAGLLEGYKYFFLGCFAEHLWFFLMLFWVTLIFILLKPLLSKKLLPLTLVIVIGLSVAAQYLLDGIEYYKLGQIAPYILIYFIGIAIYYYSEKLENMPPVLMLTVCAVLFVVSFVTIQYKDVHFAVYWLGRSTGGLSLLFLFLAIDTIGLNKKLHKTRFWQFLSKNSIVIYLYNCPIMHIYYKLLNNKIGNNVALCIAVLLILSSITLFIITFVHEKIAEMLRERLKNAGLGKKEKKKA